jgi:hypothetical protein
MGKLSELMMGGVLIAKYFDPSSLFDNIQIINTLISNTLIDLGVSIDVMNRDTMQSLGLPGLREKPIFLQLTN